MMRQTFKGIPVSVVMTAPLAAIWLLVRQKSAMMFRMAVNVALPLPNRRSTTSGIVMAMVLRIFGAKYASGIIAMDAVSTYQMALMPQEPNALPARPVVEPPPMLLAERENATMNKPMRRPATM